jgi:hypothetical protein
MISQTLLLFSPANKACSIACLFEIMVVVAVQSVFCLETHQNEVFFLFYFKLFLTSTHQNNLKTYKKIILNKKNSKFLEIQFTLYSQTHLI